METKTITGAEYEASYIPLGGFILVAKDLMPQKQGKLYLPDTVKAEHSKYTCTGVVVSKSPVKKWEDEIEETMWNSIKKGDRIGFSGTVPLYSPSPPAWNFEGEDKERYVTIHIRDVLCFISSSKDQFISLMERFS